MTLPPPGRCFSAIIATVATPFSSPCPAGSLDAHLPTPYLAVRDMRSVLLNWRLGLLWGSQGKGEDCGWGSRLHPRRGCPSLVGPFLWPWCHRTSDTLLPRPGRTRAEPLLRPCLPDSWSSCSPGSLGGALC